MPYHLQNEGELNEMARQKAATAIDLRESILSIVQIANEPGTSRTEMLDSFDQIIEEAQTVYPDVLDDLPDEEQESAGEEEEGE